MLNPFYNQSEARIRAGWRIFSFLFAYLFFLSLGSILPSSFLQYLYNALLTIGLLFLSFKFIEKRSVADGGYEFNKVWFLELGWGILIGFLAVAIIFLIEWQTNMLVITDFEWTTASPNYRMILLFLFQMMVVGFYEEAAFRGIMVKNMVEGFQMDKMQYRIPVLIAVLFSSSLFGFAHMGNPNASLVSTTNIILAGIMLALPFILSGRLAMPIGIHAAWNFTLGGVFGFPVSGLDVQNTLIHIQQDGEDLWTGGDFGPEAGLLGVFGILFIMFMTWIFYRMRDKEVKLHVSFREHYLERFPSTLPPPKSS